MKSEFGSHNFRTTLFCYEVQRERARVRKADRYVGITFIAAVS